MSTPQLPHDRSNDAHAILQSAGFQIRCNRATCPFCKGHRALTVAVHGELFFCHRCQRGGNIRQLARMQGRSLLATRVRLADKPKAAFRQWLSQKMTSMSREEYRLYRRAQWAKWALQFYPSHEGALGALARWHHAQRRFEMFWESAGDRIGRYGLYRAWRTHGQTK